MNENCLNIISEVKYLLIELEQISLKKKTPDSYLKDYEKGVENTEFFLITVEHISLIFNICFVL